MARRTTPKTRQTQKKTELAEHVCDDCKHARWIETHENKDWKGRYICLRCPFEQWGIIRGSKTCEKFELKTEQQ